MNGPSFYFGLHGIVGGENAVSKLAQPIPIRTIAFSHLLRDPGYLDSERHSSIGGPCQRLSGDSTDMSECLSLSVSSSSDSQTDLGQVDDSGLVTIVHEDESSWQGFLQPEGNVPRQGWGTFIYANGTREKGNWKEGRRVGWFTITNLDLSQWKGCFGKDGQTLKDGSGTFIYPNGTRETGYWTKGNRVGKFTINNPDGSKYEGTFTIDKKGREVPLTGNGTIIYSNGSSETGHWFDGVRGSGHWILIRDGSRYEGTLCTDEYGNECPWEGEGTFVFHDGSKETGEWEDSERIKPKPCSVS